MSQQPDIAPTDEGFDAELQLHEISTLLIREGDIDALYERILDAAVRLMSAAMGSMQMLHPERNALRLLTWRGFHPESAAFWKWVGHTSGTSCALAFAEKRRIVVTDIESGQLVTDDADLAAFRRSQIRAVQSTPLVSRTGALLGVISTHWREPHQPGERELRRLDVLARQAADLIERTRAEIALRESEDRLRWLASIVEFSDDAIVGKSLDGIIATWNGGAERIFGYEASEVIGKPITILMPPDRQHEEPAILERIRRGERVDHFETVRRRKDGSSVDMSLTISPIRDAEGKIIGASKIGRDITERKRSETQLIILAREAEHRSKNVLATVQATVRMSQAGTPEALKRAIEGRIQALANVHSLFAESRWKGAGLRRLVEQELAAYRQDAEVRVEIDGLDVMLETGTAQAIAVAIHELATNAVKYGALSVREGRVRVAWTREAPGQLVLFWTETGGPMVATPTGQGLGMRVIESLIGGQLEGAARFEWEKNGLVCELRWPA